MLAAVASGIGESRVGVPTTWEVGYQIWLLEEVTSSQIEMVRKVSQRGHHKKLPKKKIRQKLQNNVEPRSRWNIKYEVSRKKK